MEQGLSMAAVVRRTRLLPDTIRSWERRHGLVVPRRASSGVRVYSDEDVARLELAREATQLGHPIRYVARMTNQEIELVLKRSPLMQPDTTSYGSVVATAMRCLEEFKFAGVQQILTATALSAPREEYALQFLAPLLRAIGAAWSEGQLSIAQEHAVSQLIRHVTGSFALQVAWNDAVPLVFATPPNELHEFGVALGSVVAAAHGYAPCVLGSNVPASECVRAAERVGPRALIIGSLAQPGDPEVVSFLRHLRVRLPARVDLWVGGTHAKELCGGIDGVTPFPTLEQFAQVVRSGGPIGVR